MVAISSTAAAPGKIKISKAYTSACIYTSEPRLTIVWRLVTLFFSKFSMFRLKFELQAQSQAKACTSKHQASTKLNCHKKSK